MHILRICEKQSSDTFVKDCCLFFPFCSFTISSLNLFKNSVANFSNFTARYILLPKRRVSPQSFDTNATISLSWQHCDNERQTDFGQTQPGGVAFCQKDLHSQICLHFVKNGQIANHNISPWPLVGCRSSWRRRVLTQLDTFDLGQGVRTYGDLQDGRFHPFGW